MSQPPKPGIRRPTAQSPISASPIDARDVLRGAMGRRQHSLSLFRRKAAFDPPIDRLIAEALQLALHSLQVDRCAYAVREAEGDDFRLAAAIGWPGEVIGRASLSGDPESLGGHTLRVGRPVVVEDLRQFPAFSGEPLLADWATRSVLIAPVRGQGGMSGLLGAFGARRRLFSPDEADFLLGLANVIAAALYREDWRRHLGSARAPREPNRPSATRTPGGSNPGGHAPDQDHD